MYNNFEYFIVIFNYNSAYSIPTMWLYLDPIIILKK